MAFGEAASNVRDKTREQNTLLRNLVTTLNPV
jgi:hypothetical protein